jgi:DNA repair exonuclease SbcCD ATPase subunit
MFSRKSKSQLERESAKVREMILKYNNQAKSRNWLPDFVIPKGTNKQLNIPPLVNNPTQKTPWKIQTEAFDKLSEQEKNKRRMKLQTFLKEKPPDYKDLESSIRAIEKEERAKQIRELEQQIEALKAKQRIKKLQDELKEKPDDISHLLGGRQKPTKKPTTKPIKKPTIKPTKKPTTKPTTKPTKKPTTKPTKKPTTKKL